MTRKRDVFAFYRKILLTFAFEYARAHVNINFRKKNISTKKTTLRAIEPTILLTTNRER